MNENILRDLKILFDIKSDKSDEKLNLLIRLVLDEIRIYIGYKDDEKLPKKVEKIALSIIRKYLKKDNMGISDIETKDIKSIKRGDTSIEYTTSNIIDSLSSSDLIESELILLRHFKRIRMA